MTTTSSIPICVCFGCDSRYVPHMAVTMVSLLDHAAPRPIRFFVFQRDIDQPTRDAFAAMLAPWPHCQIEWIDVTRPDLGAFRAEGHLTVATYFRLFIAELLPAEYERVIYLDSDIVVTGDLAALWESDLAGHPLGAVVDPLRTEDDHHDRFTKLGLPRDAAYFNGGVLVLDLRQWRERGLTRRLTAFAVANPHKLTWADQDVLNALLHDDHQPLAMEWNLQRRMCHMLPHELGLSIPDYLRLRRAPKIVHFTEALKPWSYRDGHPFAHLYFRYLKRTPFRAEVERTWQLSFATTFGRWLRRLKNWLKVLPPVLRWRERRAA